MAVWFYAHFNDATAYRVYTCM